MGEMMPNEIAIDTANNKARIPPAHAASLVKKPTINKAPKITSAPVAMAARISASEVGKKPITFLEYATKCAQSPHDAYLLPCGPHAPNLSKPKTKYPAPIAIRKYN